MGRTLHAKWRADFRPLRRYQSWPRRFALPGKRRAQRKTVATERWTTGCRRHHGTLARNPRTCRLHRPVRSWFRFFTQWTGDQNLDPSGRRSRMRSALQLPGHSHSPWWWRRGHCGNRWRRVQREESAGERRYLGSGFAPRASHPAGTKSVCLVPGRWPL